MDIGTRLGSLEVSEGRKRQTDNTSRNVLWTKQKEYGVEQEGIK